VASPCPVLPNQEPALGRPAPAFFSGRDGGVSYRREILRRISHGSVPSLKITVSVGQGRPWAPRKAFQQRKLEVLGGCAVARFQDLGPHRGLTGTVETTAWKGPRTERQPADRKRPMGGCPFWWFGGREEGAPWRGRFGQGASRATSPRLGGWWLAGGSMGAGLSGKRRTSNSVVIYSALFRRRERAGWPTNLFGELVSAQTWDSIGET
jgi:hypothetical protein